MNGANNLYVYDAATGMTKFVAELCSGPELSGSNQGPKPQGSHHVTSALAVSDPACPASVSPEISTFIPPQGNDDVLWLPGNGGQAEMTANGNYLLFASWGRLTPDDTDNVPDIFRFDFQTAQLTRISVGHDGNDGNGNDNAYPVEFPNATGEGAEKFLRNQSVVRK